MAVITTNDFGAIVVNDKVLSKMIVEDLLDMSETIIPCNKKGKQIKHSPNPFEPDYYDAVELSVRKERSEVSVNIIVRAGNNISEIAGDLADRIEKDFTFLKLDFPKSITVHVRGIMEDELVRKNIEITRTHDVNAAT